MRILGAFDKFKDSFGAEEACSLLLRSVEESSLDHPVIFCPLTDGGEGFVDTLARGHAVEKIETPVRNSLARRKPAHVHLFSIADLSDRVRSLLALPKEGKLAVLEMASACPLSELSQKERNALNTTTLGVGDLLLAAKSAQADVILLGIGGSSTNDAGIGALRSLGLELLDQSGRSLDSCAPKDWPSVHSIDASSLKSLPRIVIACDVENPLLGIDGATRRFGPQKGLVHEQVEKMEDAMRSMVRRLSEIQQRANSLAEEPGAGAAGGLGFGLSLFYEVNLVSGFELVAEWLDLERKVLQSDLIVTGEGKLDPSSLFGKGPIQLLRMAERAEKPSLFLCASMDRQVVRELALEFKRTRFLAFAKEEWSLERNLSEARSLFLATCGSFFRSFADPPALPCNKLKETRFKRIRRIKRLLRHLPRRSNVHNYPVLKWFSETAYKRAYLWSFKNQYVCAALFLGIWVSLLPIVGIQMIVVFLLAVLLRANLPIAVALQWISNPLTMGPLYFADYKVGMDFLELLGVDYPHNQLLSPDYDWSKFSFKELLRLVDTFPPMFVGGSILGIFLGVVAVFLYKSIAKFYKP